MYCNTGEHNTTHGCRFRHDYSSARIYINVNVSRFTVPPLQQPDLNKLIFNRFFTPRKHEVEERIRSKVNYIQPSWLIRIRQLGPMRRDRVGLN